MKKTIEYLNDKKKCGQKITALTSYDYPTTMIIEESEIDMVVLGDSVGTNVLGYSNETEVTMEDMVHHAKAVCRAKRDCFLVVDLPYNSYKTPEFAKTNANKLATIGADAIKFEGNELEILKALKDIGLIVMCHLGLNPQFDQKRMQKGNVAKGKLFNEAIELIKSAKAIENAGADLLILEKIPEKISRLITKNIKVPTIGIGAGKYCDGQVLIINDMLGITERKFRHNPDYINLREVINKTIQQYKHDVCSCAFPAIQHSNVINDSEYDQVEKWCLRNHVAI